MFKNQLETGRDIWHADSLWSEPLDGSRDLRLPAYLIPRDHLTNSCGEHSEAHAYGSALSIARSAVCREGSL